jgi:hypothetical protein
MKKILSLLVISILFLTSTEAVAITIKDIDSNLKWGQNENKEKSIFDEIDQEQSEMDWFGPIGPCPLTTNISNYIIAQTFLPTKNVLTKVELMVVKNITTIYDYTVAIRSNLSGDDLTFTSIPAANVSSENFSWEEFDFTDIAVIPGNTYYIVSYTVNATENWYAWGLKTNGTSYPNGTIYYSEDDEVTWTEEPDGDMTFKTYGIDNHAPEIPSIDGPTHGKVRVALEYTFLTTDPDGDDVYYVVRWGCCGNETHTYGPYPSGVAVTINHTWKEKGTFTIKVKAKDIYNFESDWTTFEIKIPRIRNQIFLIWLLERLKLLKQIF